jgi:hypothetical protein
MSTETTEVTADRLKVARLTAKRYELADAVTAAREALRLALEAEDAFIAAEGPR